MASATVLELRMEKASFLKNVSEVLSGLFSTADFEFSSTGLELQAMDSSGDAFVVLQLRSEAFDLYICNNDDLSVRLNLADMAKAFSFANNDDIVTIKYQNGGKTVTISLDSPDGDVISDLDCDFNAKHVHISEYPESLYEVIVRMPSAKFMHFCNKLSSFWDTGDRKTVVSISVDEDNVSFFTDGELKSSTIVCLQTQNDDKPNEATCIEMKEKISLTFDLRYLNSLSKASTLSDQVTIKHSSNVPAAVFEYKIAEMGYIRYYVMQAPPAPLLLAMPPATILELRMEKATFLKNVLEVLSGLFSKANLQFSSTGLELQAMDTCGFALVVLQLRSEAFDTYICNDDDLSVGLILADMAKASSFANNDDIITIEAQDGVEAVVIKIKSPDGSVIEYFKLNFVGVNDVPLAIPEQQEFEYQAIISMPSAEFMHFCNRLSSFTRDMKAARVCISVDKERVQFFTAGILGCSRIVCQMIQTVDKKSKEATGIEVKMKENVSQTFCLSYMSSLCKASTLSDQVTIKLSSKLPAVFEYNIAEMGYIRYHVVPTDIKAEEDKDAELMTSVEPFAYFVVPMVLHSR